MRVIHVITRLIIGGAQENTLFNVEDLAARYKDRVTLVTGPAEGPEGDLFERARRNRVDLVLLPELVRPIRPREDWATYRRLTRLFTDERPDVVHTHSSKAGILGRAAAHRCGVPAIIHTMHGLPFHPYERWWRNALYRLAERYSARRCDRIITVADAMIKQALAARVATREKFVTIPSGMEVEPFLAAGDQREGTRAELGFGRDDIVIGKVARLFEYKGHDDVIAAAATVVAAVPNARFLFVGGGTWRERLEHKIAAAGLETKFRFTGLVPPDRIPALLAATDMVVHASYREGLARVLPQALITGKPVVSYDVDGAREVVLPGDTGFLVSPGDVAGLARALIELARNSELRGRMGVAGRRKFTDLFRHERMTERIRAVYLDVLKTKGNPAGREGP